MAGTVAGTTVGITTDIAITVGTITDTITGITVGTQLRRLSAAPLAWRRSPSRWQRAAGPTVTGILTINSENFCPLSGFTLQIKGLFAVSPRQLSRPLSLAKGYCDLALTLPQSSLGVEPTQGEIPMYHRPIVLIVEDEPFFSMTYEDIVIDAGLSVSGTFASCELEDGVG